MTLRSLVMSGGVLSAGLLLPIVVICALSGHPEISRGLIVGMIAGLLNNLLLARKFDRVNDGREAWQNLGRGMYRNMLLRFSMILAIGAIAAHLHTINLLGIAGGLALCLFVNIICSAWVVYRQWKKEDGTPVWLQSH